MRRTAFTATLLLLSAANGIASGMENLHISHCLQGCPSGTPDSNEVIVRHLYAVSINAETRLADWVSYRILPGSIGVASLLPRDWQTDQLSRSGVRLEELGGEDSTLVQPNLGNQPESVYRISEFSVNAGDRGRLVPMTAFAASSYWSDLNLLSVMSFMKSDLRLESWARLDQAVNALVVDEGELTVIAGPIYGSNAGSGGANSIPEAFFKVVANEKGELATFVFAQDLPVHASYCAQMSDLETVERATGLTLFPEADAWPAGSLAQRLGC